VKWAQRKASVFLTIDAHDVSTDEGFSIALTPEGQVAFTAKNKQGTVAYHFELTLFGEIVVEESKQKVTDLHVQLSIAKKNKTDAHWPRLTRDKVKLNWLTCDWDKWVDEDEEAEGKGAEDFGPMDDMPDYGGGADEEEDSDEDEEEGKPDLGDLEGEAEAQPPAPVEEAKAVPVAPASTSD